MNIMVQLYPTIHKCLKLLKNSIVTMEVTMEMTMEAMDYGGVDH